MQKIKKPRNLLSLFYLFPALFLFSCSRNSSEKKSLIPETEITFSKNPVQVVIAEQIAAQENIEKVTDEKKQNTVSSNAHDFKYDSVDIDLTVMSSTMIYSTVFQFLIDWETSEGKIVKIKGDYTPFFRKEKQKLYHNVIVRDATACCKEGLEFVWGDGNHFDSEFPPSGTEVIVTGVFELYYEDDKMEVQSIRLKDASMEIL